MPSKKPTRSSQARPAKRAVASQLVRAYALMRGRFGHLHWWPGETPFEVCVGAILTQNTAWSNVERAIANLKAAGVLQPHAMLALPPEKLAELIRPAGYFNVKTRRLWAFLRMLVEGCHGDLSELMAGPTPTVRERLLNLHGVGRETADSMLLYAGNHPSFVIDAYTKRIFTRHGWWHASQSGKSAKSNTAGEYESLKALCEKSLAVADAVERLDLWQDYHAQLVMVGKHHCKTRQPDCAQCPLRALLPPGGKPVI